MRRSWRALLVFTLLIGIVTVVSACGSSSSSSSSSSTTAEPSEAETGGTEEKEGSSQKQAAEEFVAEHSNLENLKWPVPPDEPYDPGTGKIGIVSAGNTGSGDIEMGKEAIKAADLAGWEPTEILDGKYTPSVQSGIVQQLITEKAKAILLIAIQPEQIASAVNEAIEANIPVTCAYCQSGPEFKSFGGPVTMATQNGVEDGEYVAAYIGAHAEGKARVDVLGDDPAFAILIERTEGVEAGLKKYCPECELTVTKMSAEELGKPGPPAFSALLSSNPPGSLEWVIGGPADPFGELIMKTAEQEGRTDIKMIGLDASPAVLENIAEGGITQTDTSAGYRYAAWAGVELGIRQADGLKPWKADDMPRAFITKENVSGPLEQLPRYFQPPAFDYEKIFEEVWSGK